MPIEPGQQLLHYRLTEKIGEGGMGVVWKAQDTTLDREVAVKILPDLFSNDPERLARFEREAKLLASLTHSNIAAVYGLHESDGVRFLAMEYVAGENLAQRLGRGGLPVQEALDIGLQVALALEAAHDSGVIHRDLKPANIQITAEGRVKVLDFGLAKAFETDPASGSGLGPTHSPTLTSAGTRAGVILGTAAYMSPEQARGKPLDKRTDNWSFGCVLFECLTGQQIFSGETVTDMLARILERDPDWTRLPDHTPNRVRRLLERCLAKEASRRLRDIGDARLELEEAISALVSSRASGAGHSVAAERHVGRRMWTLVAVAFVLGAVVGGFAFRSLLSSLESRTASGSQRVALQIPEELELRGWALSPVGESLIFGAVTEGEGEERFRRQLYRRPLDSYEPEPIEGTQGVGSFAVSPAGEWIALEVTHGNRTEIKKVSMRGGPAVTIWQGAPGTFGTFDWIDEGFLLFVSDFDNGELSRISVDSGDTQVISAGAETGGVGDISSVEILPRGAGALLTVYTEGGEGWSGHIEHVSFSSGKRNVVIDDGADAAYAAGHLVFSRRDTLLAAPFDPASGKVTGGVKPMLSGMRMFAVWADAGFHLSPSGDLLYIPGGNVGADRRLVWVDRAGSIEPLSELRRPFDGGSSFSPDGKRLAVYMSGDNRSWQVWVYDLERDTLRRIGVPDRDCWAPIWFPDGRNLLFLTGKTGEPNALYRVDVDRGGAPELVYKAESTNTFIEPTSLSPDGSVLAMNIIKVNESAIHLLPLDGSGEPRPLFDREDQRTWDARFSPDGKWLAYGSDETERGEVYVAPYPVISSGWLVSKDGGRGARWSPDGKELFFESDEGMQVVDLTFAPRFKAASPELLFDPDALELRHRIAIAPDGQRFVYIQKGPKERDVASVNLVLNWAAELE